jgi:hypothetical protein
MVFQRCSDVVDSRVERAIPDTESGKNAAFNSVSEQPRRANLSGDARTSDDHSPRRTGPLYKRVERLVNRSHHRVGVTKIIRNKNRLTG